MATGWHQVHCSAYACCARLRDTPQGTVCAFVAFVRLCTGILSYSCAACLRVLRFNKEEATPIYLFYRLLSSHNLPPWHCGHAAHTITPSTSFLHLFGLNEHFEEQTGDTSPQLPQIQSSPWLGCTCSAPAKSCLPVSWHDGSTTHIRPTLVLPLAKFELAWW